MDITQSAITLDIINDNICTIAILLKIQISVAIIMLYPLLKGVVDRWFKL